MAVPLEIDRLPIFHIHQCLFGRVVRRAICRAVKKYFGRGIALGAISGPWMHQRDACTTLVRFSCVTLLCFAMRQDI